MGDKQRVKRLCQGHRAVRKKDVTNDRGREDLTVRRREMEGVNKRPVRLM